MSDSFTLSSRSRRERSQPRTAQPRPSPPGPARRAPAPMLVAALLLACFSGLLAGNAFGQISTGPLKRKFLRSLTVEGPSTIQENGTAAYTAIAHFNDGSAVDVTELSFWSVQSPYATVDRGLVSTQEVPSDQSAVVTASYSALRQTKSGSLTISILDTAPPSVSLTAVAVSGPASVPENSSATYAATASFSDGTTQTVTSSAVWSENSPYAAIAAGVLTTGEVPSDQTVTVTAAYTFEGVTRTGSLSLIVGDILLTGSHVGRFSAYAGTATCLTCHANEAAQMHQSVHYQWLGDASESDGLNSASAGKLGGINDFCIYPDINWIGKLTNADGVSVDGGCARCHAGLGAKPEASPTQAQLENIDCLLCHSKNYKRTVGTVNGAFRFVPNTAAMSVSLLQAAVDITRPDKDTCLNCHTKAGGGDNLKRGDIEEAHRNATAAFDVHMAPSSAGGAGLQCLDCHTTIGHKIAGRGIDMRERDIPNAVLCQNCHSTAPHDSPDLNRHTTRLNCNTCHVPEFAKVAATDMVRDWSQPGDLHPITKLYEPHMTLASHVQPEYAWFNGRSTFYQFGEPAVPGANGKVLMAGPQGSVQDPDAKINAVKHHFGKQPVDPVTRRLFPLKIGIFFSTGDVDTAVAQGAAGVGWPYTGHEFADTERYMGLYHEVAPADQALQCASCHDNGDQRMNFGQLGYTPKTTRNGQPLCSSCHGAKTASFYTLHNKHVRDKRINCVECHTFSQVTN